MLVKDPSDPERTYVKHYQLDFGSALGSSARTNGNPRVGHEYTVDIPSMFGSLATLGLHRRTWGQRSFPDLRGLRGFDRSQRRCPL